MTENIQTRTLLTIAKILLNNREHFLMDLQGDHCGCNGGKPKLVYRSPAAHQLGRLLDGNQWIKTENF